MQVRWLNSNYATNFRPDSVETNVLLKSPTLNGIKKWWTMAIFCHQTMRVSPLRLQTANMELRCEQTRHQDRVRLRHLCHCCFVLNFYATSDCLFELSDINRSFSFSPPHLKWILWINYWEMRDVFAQFKSRFCSPYQVSFLIQSNSIYLPHFTTYKLPRVGFNGPVFYWLLSIYDV